MNSVQKRRANGGWVFVLLGFIVLLSVGMTPEVRGQNVSEWTIPGNTVNPSPPNIQGLHALYPEAPYNSLYFTEYDRATIGMLSDISGGSAVVAEWAPLAPLGSALPMHPFKITAGMWSFNGPLVDPPSFVNIKYYSKFLTLFQLVDPVPTFTLPDEGKIGMVVSSPLPLSVPPANFWVYPTASAGLDAPWDIQRRYVGSSELSAWVSNKTPLPAIFQFFPPTTKTPAAIKRWDFSNICGNTVTPGGSLLVKVFYVVPSSTPKLKTTEIWIGGVHVLGGVLRDCIAYMKIDDRKASATVTIWDLDPVTLPAGTSARHMNSIVFTHARAAGFTNPQVWLSSSTSPEMTVLEPNSLYTSGSVDSVCTDSADFHGPNGLFWNDPSYTAALTGSDVGRRIWSTSAGTDPAAPGLSALMASKSGVGVPIKPSTCSPTVSLFPLQEERWPASFTVKQLFDSSALQSKHDNVACNMDRYIWDNTTGLTADFSGALLGINMQGKASPAPASLGGGFSYTVVWHEPTKGRIGMLWQMPAPLPLAFDRGYGQSLIDQSPNQFRLEQNYPNPFNPSTLINYSLPEDAKVTLKVYNQLGQEVATLVDGETQPAGAQSVTFKATSLASGPYYYRIVAEKTTDGKISKVMDVKKMLLLK